MEILSEIHLKHVDIASTTLFVSNAKSRIYRVNSNGKAAYVLRGHLWTGRPSSCSFTIAAALLFHLAVFV